MSTKEMADFLVWAAMYPMESKRLVGSVIRADEWAVKVVATVVIRFEGLETLSFEAFKF